MALRNKKKHQTDDLAKGLTLPRIFVRKASGKRMERLLVKCGCCESSVEVYQDEDFIEINGVLASREAWRKIFNE